MSVVLDLPLERGRVERGDGFVRVVVPAWTNLLAAFALLLVALTVRLGVHVVEIGITGISSVVPIAALLIVATPTTALVLWVLTGRTVFDVERSVMRISYKAAGAVWRSSSFAFKRISNLRVEDQPRGGLFAELGGGPIVFDYLGRSQRFGTSLGTGDASIIVANILEVTTPAIAKTEPSPPPTLAPAPAPVREDRPAKWNAESVAEEVRAELSAPPAPRPRRNATTLNESNRETRIDVPPSRDSRATAFPLFILCLSVFGIAAFNVGVQRPIQVTVAMVMAFAIGGVLCAWSLMVVAITLFRYETIVVTEKRFTIVRWILFYRTTIDREIVDRARVWFNDGHYKVYTSASGGQARIIFSMNNGPIVYQDGSETIEFGDGLQWHEAMSVVDRIHEKSPSLEI